MTQFKISVRNKDGEIKKQNIGEEECRLVYEDAYLHGDRIVIESSEVNRYVMVSVDDAMGTAFSYLTTQEFVYEIPFDEKRISYSPKAFTGNIHLILIRLATKEEIGAYKNLAFNVNDQHGTPGLFPHVSANVETRGESVFAARNAIDGNRENNSHGAWPYESWGINQNDEAEWTLEFGREVIADKIVMYTRADFPHDNWWVNVTLCFSDGSTIDWALEKTNKPHVLTFAPKTIHSLTLCKLIKADDPSPFPALSQFEVYGTEKE